MAATDPILIPTPSVSRRRRHPIAAFVARRVAAGIGLLAIISVLVFGATNVLPGDVAAAVLGRQATPESVAGLRQELGLDRPLVPRYLDWVGGVLHGDLGQSLAGTQAPVWTLIRDPLVNTLTLAGLTILVLIPLSLLLGIAAGVRVSRPLDQGISGVTLAITAVPEFVIGALLVLVFAVSLGVLPAVSLIPPGTNPLADPSLVVLPVATLVLAGLAYMVRIVRAGVADVVLSDFVEMARLNGVRERRVITRYAVRNALAPTVQALAATIQWLLGGVFVVETLFSYPGIGRALIVAVTVRDFPVIEAAGLLIAAFYIALNIVADIAIVLLIPKLRTAQE
jgi:peptide/nickel transport system permease protein